MRTSIASKLLALSAFAVLAGAIIASPASALNIPNETTGPCAADSAQLTLISAGQVQGTGFCPGTEAYVEFEDSISSQGFEGYSYDAANLYPIVSADGTFTVPLVYSRPAGFHPVTWVRVTANDKSGLVHYGPDGVDYGTDSNTLIVTVPLPARAF